MPCPGASQQVETPTEMPQPATPASSGAEKDALAVEGFNWKELNMVPKNYCQHCKMAVDPECKKVVKKKGHAAFSCKTCHNITTMLYKKQDMNKVGFKDLSVEQTTDFFVKAGQLATQHGSLNWSKVKGLMIDKLSEAEVFRQTVAVRGKFLPLSVWKQKGFDVEKIEKTAEKQKSDLFLGPLINAYYFMLLQIYYISSGLKKRFL